MSSAQHIHENLPGDEFMEYQEAAGGKIIQVTLAPELEGAMEFISNLLQRMGLLLLSGIQMHRRSRLSLRLLSDGARLSTHLGNGCANLIHRHNNPIWPQLGQ